MRRFLRMWVVFLIPAVALATETKLIPVDSKGESIKAEKVFAWTEADCRLEKSGELIVTLKGKDFRDGKLTITLRNYERANPSTTVVFEDESRIGWTVDFSRNDQSHCKVVAENHVFEDKQVKSLEISMTCLKLVPVNEKATSLLGVYGFEIPRSNPIACLKIKGN